MQHLFELIALLRTARTEVNSVVVTRAYHPWVSRLASEQKLTGETPVPLPGDKDL